MIKKIILKIYESLNLIFSFIYLRAHGVETGFGYVRLSGRPIIWKHPHSRIILGKNVHLVSASRFNMAGINHPVILATLAPGATIEMRDHSGASGAAINAVKDILVDSYAQIGANANIYGTDFHCLEPKQRKAQTKITQAKSGAITIGENAWIGADAIILKGVKIGKNSVVGAGSVVTKDVENNTIVAGNPAKVIKKIVL